MQVSAIAPQPMAADLIFIEAMLARGAEVHVVMPFKREDFIETNVRFAGDKWVARFDQALGDATTVTYACEEGYLNDDTLFQYAADLVGGLTLLRADQLGVEALLLAVFDGDSSNKTGGTAENLARWESPSRAVEVLDLAVMRAGIEAVKLDHRPVRNVLASSGDDDLRIARQVCN